MTAIIAKCPWLVELFAILIALSVVIGSVISMRPTRMVLWVPNLRVLWRAVFNPDIRIGAFLYNVRESVQVVWANIRADSVPASLAVVFFVPLYLIEGLPLLWYAAEEFVRPSAARRRAR